MILKRVRQIHDDLRCGKVEAINFDNSKFINEVALNLLNKQELNREDLEITKLILDISNILYNNTDRSIIFLEDGIYDLLINMYARFSPDGSYPVGAIPVKFESTANEANQVQYSEAISPIIYYNQDVLSNSLFINEYGLARIDQITIKDFQEFPVENPDLYITKRQTIVPHKYPKLVGTLDKCKFVLMKDAIDRGVQNDKNVSIFERDFLGKHLEMGIFDPYPNKVELIAELKYDGISVEAEVTDRVISARTRGDTDSDMASDLTPLLEGYPFKKAIGAINFQNPIGMKFEAVITNENLYKLSQLTGKEYKNPRVAIIGLMGSSDARKYRDLITLVPLATSMDITRPEEIEFMNTYYTSGECLRHAYISGDYVSALFQVNKFVQEAEYLRPFINIMYDGVVIEYYDPYLIQQLGRVNSVNKYSVAIKFNALKKQTIFLGYDFTVGQNGVITPMIYYEPVEFYGSIHNKSSGHSFERFKNLGLAVGDIIDVEYVNDVMPYVTKPDNEHNRNNPNPPVPFAHICPSCGSVLVMSQSGKSVVCPNGACGSRNLMRMVNMLHKLGVKDFSEESLKKINKFSLYDLFRLKIEDLESLGDTNSVKFIEQMNVLKTQPIADYKIVGALGFTNIALDTWKLILNNIPLEHIISWADDSLYQVLVQIKGIGPTTAITVTKEREWFMPDLMTISAMQNVSRTFGVKSEGKEIRFSGIRDQQLCDMLNSLGHNATDGALTKKTNILIVPTDGYTSKKTETATKNGTVIYSYDYFKANLAQCLK